MFVVDASPHQKELKFGPVPTVGFSKGVCFKDNTPSLGLVEIQVCWFGTKDDFNS